MRWYIYYPRRGLHRTVAGGGLPIALPTALLRKCVEEIWGDDALGHFCGRRQSGRAADERRRIEQSPGLWHLVSAVCGIGDDELQTSHVKNPSKIFLDLDA